MRFGLRFGKQTKCWFLHLKMQSRLSTIGQHGAQSIVLHFSVGLLSCYKHCKHCRPYIEKVLSSRMQCHYQIDRVPYKCAVTNYIRCVNAFINIQEWWNLSVQYNPQMIEQESALYSAQCTVHSAAQSSHRNRNSAHATAAADRIARTLLTHILLH